MVCRVFPNPCSVGIEDAGESTLPGFYRPVKAVDLMLAKRSCHLGWDLGSLDRRPGQQLRVPGEIFVVVESVEDDRSGCLGVALCIRLLNGLFLLGLLSLFEGGLDGGEPFGCNLHLLAVDHRTGAGAAFERLGHLGLKRLQLAGRHALDRLGHLGAEYLGQPRGPTAFDLCSRPLVDHGARHPGRVFATFDKSRAGDGRDGLFLLSFVQPIERSFFLHPAAHGLVEIGTRVLDEGLAFFPVRALNPGHLFQNWLAGLVDHQIAVVAQLVGGAGTALSDPGLKGLQLLAFKFAIDLRDCVIA